MPGLTAGAVCTLARIVQKNSLLLSSLSRQSIILTQNRYKSTKHWNPKWKKLRAWKVIKVDLPNYDEDDDPMIEAEKVRTKMKEQGLQPSTPWQERPMFLSCTATIFEEYVPPEGDGKFSTLSTSGAKQKVDFMAKKGKGYMAVKKIRRYDEEFSIGEFEDQVQDIYVKTHEAIANNDEEALRSLVTERAYPEVRHNTIDKTIRWKFIESLTPPRVVHARCTELLTRDNVFGQVTVRFHTQQTLAVYDRFGRLMHGSEIVKKDVLEYVVFEKHLANQYGLWRIHAKIIPSWMPPRESATRTYRLPPETPEENEPEKPQKQDEVSVAHIDKESSSPQPAVA